MAKVQQKTYEKYLHLLQHGLPIEPGLLPKIVAVLNGRGDATQAFTLLNAAVNCNCLVGSRVLTSFICTYDATYGDYRHKAVLKELQNGAQAIAALTTNAAGAADKGA